MTSPPDLLQRKTALRREARARRAAIPESVRTEAAQAIAALLDPVSPPERGVVAGYWPLPGELDPRPCMAHLAERGWAMALPRMDGRGKPLRFLAWRQDDVLVEGPFAVMEPRPSQPALTPTVVLVPLLAFDRRGGRLGYGQGFYDRTLRQLRAAAEGSPLTIGLAFADQEVAEVPVGPDDVPLDAVVTERGLHRFTLAGRPS